MTWPATPSDPTSQISIQLCHFSLSAMIWIKFPELLAAIYDWLHTAQVACSDC